MSNRRVAREKYILSPRHKGIAIAFKRTRLEPITAMYAIALAPLKRSSKKKTFLFYLCASFT